jgi:hypothetical protein
MILTLNLKTNMHTTSVRLTPISFSDSTPQLVANSRNLPADPEFVLNQELDQMRMHLTTVGIADLDVPLSRLYRATVNFADDSFQRKSDMKDRIQVLFFATLLEEQISKLPLSLQEKIQFKPSLNILVIRTLDRFLATRKLDPIQKVFHTLVAGCAKVIFLNHTASSYMQNKKKYKGAVRAAICYDVYQSLLRLPVGEKWAVPGGWPTINDMGLEGHFLLYSFERVDALSYIKTRFSVHRKPTDSGGQISLIEHEKIYKNHLPHFLEELFVRQFASPLVERLESISPEKDLKSEMYQMTMGYARVQPCHAYPSVKINDQKHAYNCMTIPFFGLYEYLLKRKYRSKPAAEARFAADSLRYEYQRFLVQQEQNNPELLKEVFRLLPPPAPSRHL